MPITGIDAVKAKIRKACHALIDAWWVFLIIIIYSVLAHFFLGSSCLLASTTGLPCPGCGGTRAFMALIHGEVLESVIYHPLLIPVAVILGINFVLWLLCEKVPHWFNRVILVLAVAIVALYAARLILFFPHDEPMTYNQLAVLPRIIRLITGLFSA